MVCKNEESRNVETQEPPQDAAFKARLTLEALKGEHTVSELATACEVHLTMIPQWKQALLESGGISTQAAVTEREPDATDQP